MINRLSNNDEQIVKELRITSFWFSMATLLGLALIFLRFSVPGAVSLLQTRVWVIQGRAFTSLLWGLGWFAAAFLFGFIFAVPKAAQRKTDSDGKPAPDSAESTRSQTPTRLKTNTNLEEISDWLTKVLVGATLTQLIRIPALIKAAAGYMATNMGDPAYETFAAAVLLYFCSIGFLTGYVLTRTFFSRQFERSESTSVFSQDDKEALRDTAFSIGSDVQVSKAAQHVLAKSDAVPITDALSGTDASAVATAALLRGDQSRALQAATLAVAKAPNDARSHLNYAAALYNVDRKNPAIMQELQLALRLIDPKNDPRTAESVASSIVYLALYLPGPQGFQKAIECGETYLQSARPRNASIFINLACGYGQKYRYLPANDTERTATRDKALKYVKAAIEVEPDSVVRLRELYLGNGPDPEDDDLRVFQGDPDFDTELA